MTDVVRGSFNQLSSAVNQVTDTTASSITNAISSFQPLKIDGKETVSSITANVEQAYTSVNELIPNFNATETATAVVTAAANAASSAATTLGDVSPEFRRNRSSNCKLQNIKCQECCIFINKQCCI